jgi:hypothetical protein
MSMESITGGCGCGAVRYRAKGPIGFHILCQCRFCQRFSGSVHSALLAVPKAGLVIEGPAKGYSYDNGLGGIRLRVFCSICGSGIHGGNPDEDFVTLIASSLDDPSLFAPTEVVNRDEAAPWHKKAANLILHDEAG